MYHDQLWGEAKEDNKKESNDLNQWSFNMIKHTGRDPASITEGQVQGNMPRLIIEAVLKAIFKSPGWL